MDREEVKDEPCGWCRKEPTFWDDGGGITGAHCNTATCPHFEKDCPPDAWNEWQKRILAERRKDFEAGWMHGSCDEETGEFLESSWNDYIAKDKE